MDKVEKIRREIASRIEEQFEWFNPDCEGKDIIIETLSSLQTFIDSLQEEPVNSIWHDAKEPPEMYRKYFARYSDGRINGSWERHDDGFIPWKDVIKEHNITHWCYVEDLLKL